MWLLTVISYTPEGLGFVQARSGGCLPPSPTSRRVAAPAHSRLGWGALDGLRDDHAQWSMLSPVTPLDCKGGLLSLQVITDAGSVQGIPFTAVATGVCQGMEGGTNLAWHIPGPGAPMGAHHGVRVDSSGAPISSDHACVD